ncbi:MAG: glycine--tRNA ligase subunit beta [Bacilli bacterium]
MSKAKLLLEIGLEEMPARMIDDALAQLKARTVGLLDENHIAYGEVRTFATPRRLAVEILDVAQKGEDQEVIARGPQARAAKDANGEWTKAALGFARGQGVSPEDFYEENVKDVAYIFAKKTVSGQQTTDVLVALKEVIMGITTAKTMRWGDHEWRFVRPIQWIVALYGDAIIPFSITDVSTGRTSRGHRFLGDSFTVHHDEDYRTQLAAQFVLADVNERRNTIVAQVEAIAANRGWTIPMDEGLLDEVTHLVEWPTAFVGQFAESFLVIPSEVLVTSMREHQRYFPVEDANGKLVNAFVAVRNGDEAHIENVIRGNQKVLGARLADAEFFYAEDQKRTIDAYNAKLERIVYHEEIGTLDARVKRIEALSSHIASLVDADAQTAKVIERASAICKFDLVTNMVGEFPELQGLMGADYARIFGEDAAVCDAIAEHYMPRGKGDRFAPSLAGAVIAIAEKLDAIAGFFSIGQVPSGSADPYGLRRSAQGILQTILGHGLTLDVTALVETAVAPFESAGVTKASVADITAQIVAFMNVRFKTTLQEAGIAHDVIDAIIDTPLSDVTTKVARAHVLHTAKERDTFKGVVENVSRVCNLGEKADDSVEVSPARFVEEVETQLWTAWSEAQNTAVSPEQQYATFEAMAPVIEAYFNNVMVMADDIAVRNNRLAVMKEMSDVFKAFANFRLIVKG